MIYSVLEQMTNCICLIEYNNEKSTGFFCRIPFPDFCSLLPVLITNNHVLGDIDGIEITISMKKKDPIKLKIDKSRKKYTDKNYDITFIEIKPMDKLNINSFLEIDDKIYKEDPNKEYSKNPVYILHYPLGNDIEFSQGEIKGIDKEKKILSIHVLVKKALQEVQ